MNKRESLFKDINLDNKRGLEEEYTDYRKRLRENYYRVKYYLRGELFWDSLAKGTYRITKKK
jgi:hypothetical protein